MDAARKIEGYEPCVLSHSTGRLHLTPICGGYEARGEPAEAGVIAPHSPCQTGYPISLIQSILDCYGAVHACDEISRDIDETEAALDVKHCVEAYRMQAIGKPAVILDFGCGAGSSTITLAKLFSKAEIVGTDLMPGLLKIGAARAAHYGLKKRIEFVEQGLDNRRYDYIFLNAVYEHFLPQERASILKMLWQVLKPGGVLFLNQTPHRWFPIETHTTGLPGLNYLPDKLAHWATRKFCKRSVREHGWAKLLREGVRGATVGEIMNHIRDADPRAERLASVRHSKHWAGIWYATKRARMHKVSRWQQRAITWTQKLVEMTGFPLTPYISIAIRKSSELR